MPLRNPRLTGADFNSAKSAVNAALHQWSLPPRDTPYGHEPRVFVTVSRQCGTNGAEFAHALAERMNRDLLQGDHPWTAWDHELVERVSSEEHLSRQIVAQIEDRPQTWFEEALNSFSTSGDAECAAELRVYKRIAATLRALAEAGHAVLVGQGGRWVTQKLAAAVHVRLVAPVAYRIETTAKQYKLTIGEATMRVEETDRNRSKFFARYWPGKTLAPELFAITLNAAELTVDEMVESLVPLIHAREAGAPPQNVHTAAAMH
jgi:cytidylate kinase